MVRATARKLESNHDQKISRTCALVFLLRGSIAVLATLSFTRLPNQPPDYIVAIVNGSMTPTLVSLRFLMGDVNNTANVDANNVSETKARFGLILQ